MNLPPTISSLFNDLLNLTDQVYIVGGAVRDFLLGIENKDYDFCIDVPPEKVKAHLNKCGYQLFNLGEKFGTVSVLLKDYGVEITTFRKETGYQDYRFPIIEPAQTLAEDLARRDLTINALCYHPQRGIIDLYQGQSDLKNRIVRAVGVPSKRFTEDALRILRTIRFATRLNFTIEAATFAALKEKAPLLQNISQERIISELKGIINGNLGRGLDLITQCHLIEYTFPSLTAAQLQPLFTQQAIKVKDDDFFIAANWNYIYQNHQELIVKDLSRLHVANICLKLAKAISYADTLITSPTRVHLKLILRQITPEYIDQYCTYTRLRYQIDHSQQFHEIISSHEPYLPEHLALDGYALIDLGYVGMEIKEIKNALYQLVLEHPHLNNKEELIKAIPGIKLKKSSPD